MGDKIAAGCKIKYARGKRQEVWGKRQDFFLLLTSNFLLLAITGCAISHGIYHTIERGQTLWRISKTYNVDIQDVAEFNDITDTTQIKAGQKIFIPGVSRVLKVEPYKPTDSRPETKGLRPKSATHEPSLQQEPKEEYEGKIVSEKWRFSWPVKGIVISPFGIRNGQKHDGIDIAAQKSSSIFAADEGEVIYSDDGIRGYGNIVMLKHKQGFITVYAHNKENLVKVGEVVKKGAVIARLGDTGNASVPHLHFEVRKDRKPRNPLFFLP
ncbi:MAG: M23 family metallopeptidase [Deltaproteobacteria bacterium]|nr:M23 family metallopeptidase [Deltaproteobacteria bacterium]